MERNYSAETQKAVFGGRLGNNTRTALHVDFSHLSSQEPATKLGERGRTKAKFNTIGSLVTGTDKHLPVIDVDGGVEVMPSRNRVGKVILNAGHEGTYTPQSTLRDVLSDHGIDLEVFSYPNLGHSVFSSETYYEGMLVSALVLRARSRSLDSVDSTQKGHGHLYIQTPFSSTDHNELISGLQIAGIVSEGWADMVAQEGMSIVRTPWTNKDLSHMPS